MTFDSSTGLMKIGRSWKRGSISRRPFPLVKAKGMPRWARMSAIGQDAFQECDTVGITRPVVKHNFLVKDVRQLADVMKKAFHIARTGRPGPVVVDIPKDVSFNKTPYAGYPESVEMRSYNPVRKGHGGQIRKAVQLLLQARRPYIYTGGGVVIGNAAAELRELVDLLGFPCTNTLMGLGAMSGTDPRFLATLDAVQQRLGRNRWLLRYAHPDDFGRPETAFTICSFWHVNALHAAGRHDEARAMFERLLAARTRLGLLSEDIDPASGAVEERWPPGAGAGGAAAGLQRAGARRRRPLRPRGPPRAPREEDARGARARTPTGSPDQVDRDQASCAHEGWRRRVRHRGLPARPAPSPRRARRVRRGRPPRSPRRWRSACRRTREA